MQQLHTSAFWVYGIILGFSIREVLSKVVPHLLQLPSAEPPPAPWFVHLEIFRAVTFLFLTVTLYLSSARYFHIVYFEDPQAVLNKKNSYASDILFGFIRLLLFYAWSLTIADRVQTTWGLSHFLVLLAVVLLYNYVLLGTNFRAREHHIYGVMMASFGLVLAAGVFFSVRWKFSNEVVA